MVQHSEIVSMLCNLTLDFIEKISKLHTDYKRGHAQEDVTPKQHVNMVEEIHS